MKGAGSFIDYLRRTGWAVRVAIVGVCVALLFASGILAASLQEEAESELDAEQMLEQSCAMIEGVGRCNVIITYTEDGERVYAVAVLCDGGESLQVRSSLTELISSLYGIGTNRISVLKIKE